MELTIDLPENLAVRLNSNRRNLSRIVEAGLREVQANESTGYKSLSDVLEFLASLPTPNAILDLRPSEEHEDRIGEVLRKNREEGLDEADERFWASYEFIEHIVRMAKAAAKSKLKK